VNVQGGKYASALQAAANSDNATVQLLLKSGADVNLQGGIHGSALQEAAFRGSHTTARFLLQHGADVTVQGGEHGSALHAAALSGNDTILWLLQDKLEVNAQAESMGVRCRWRRLRDMMKLFGFC
jgi:ankyrin repeat protein